MPGFIPGVAQADTRRRYSDRVWRGCDVVEINNQKKGIVVEDDFDTFYPTASKYVISGTSATAAPIQTVPGGVVQLACTNSANGEAYLGGGIKLGAWGSIITNTPNALWYETRVKVSDITNGVYAFGLAKPSDVAAAMIADTTLVPATTVSAVGFRTLVASPSRLDIFYMDDAAATVYVTGAATLVADTYVKLGIRFNGTYGGTPNMIQFFVNGTEVANTAGTFGVLSSATNFPDSIPLTHFWAAKTNASAALTVSIDYFRGANIIDDTTYG